MDLEQLQSLSSLIADKASENIMNDGSLTPVMMFIKDGDMQLLPMIMGDDEEKDLMAYLIQSIAKDLKVDAMVMVTEGWAINRDIGAEYEAPSKAKDRLEVILIESACSEGGETRMIPILRSEDGKITGLGKPDVMVSGEMSYSRFFGDVFQKPGTVH